MYLHHDREQFVEAINLAVYKTGLEPAIIEKDYYVTLVLKKLTEEFDFVVFKGGTSLSKCYKAIARFSEDIDITIDKAVTQSQKKKLKHGIVELVDKLSLRILNLEDIRSRRDYNCYKIAYDSVLNRETNIAETTVLLEVSFAEISFPTVMLPVHSYIGDLFLEEAPDVVDHYGLILFTMKVQEIHRTLIDKVFAICDYFLSGKVKKHSRHIYDIYKLYPLVSHDEVFRDLVQEVRKERAKNKICLSAQPGVNVTALLREIVEKNIYKADYDFLTVRLLEEDVSYEEAIQTVSEIVKEQMFDE